MKKKIIIAQAVQQIIGQGNSMFARGSIALFPAASCEEILDLHRTHKADLIISEAGLRAMGGIKMCSTIRKDPHLKSVSIILICEAADPSLQEYRKTGSNEVLAKPVDAVTLFSTVSHMLMVQDRLNARIPLRLTLEGKDRKENFVALSHDISVSGLLLESGRTLQAGERLECTFSMNGRVVTIECVVVRTQKADSGIFLYGVKFLHLDAKMFVQIEHFVKSNLPGKAVHPDPYDRSKAFRQERYFHFFHFQLDIQEEQFWKSGIIPRPLNSGGRRSGRRARPSR